MGKYDAVLAGLRPAPVENQDYQSRVTECKTALHDDGVRVRGVDESVVVLERDENGRITTAEVVRLYCALRSLKEDHDERESELNLALEAAKQLLVDAFEAEGVTSMSLEGHGTVRVQAEPVAQVVDRAAFRRWCVENGLENSLQLAYNTMNALTKERLLQGQPEPDGVQAFIRSKPVLTK